MELLFFHFQKKDFLLLEHTMMGLFVLQTKISLLLIWMKMEICCLKKLILEMKSDRLKKC